METVSKARFKEVYFQYARPNDGWTKEYWEANLEPERVPPMRWSVELPPTPAHERMFIVSDFEVREHRLFFMTEEAEETHFGR